MTATDQRKELPKAYEPTQVEQRIYDFWLQKGYFSPSIDPDKKPFVIIMPPPNVTGELHVGHALTAALEDIITRWHRMKGEPTLWLPGVDHAGIATQVVVERQLAEQGTDRHELGRDEFIERVWDWVSKVRDNIVHQHQRLGISCDWSRERFTLDAGPVLAVRTTFVNLYNKGIIYRGKRIISWCPRCHTALSDLEVEHKDLTGKLWYMNYPMAEGDGFVTVATTRPETMLGDTAVAVNPDDERYKDLVGKDVILPIIGRRIPIIADSAVGIEFGTGAVKITPAHDPVDFDMAQRHDLPIVNILNPDGTMNENAGPYVGYDRFDCREGVIAQMESEGLMVRTEPYAHAVGHCIRCSTMIEPWASEQWFMKMESLAKPAIEAVRDERIKIIPEQFNKVYMHWMENIRDWCISRQLWWGHEIPVWYCRRCNELIVSVDTPSQCTKCASSDIYQDPDCLDTWFSSALWPHSTLGWPQQTEDFRYFYPTSVMETGYDILFFWVARMIMMGLENTGEIPFRTVYLHGLIRDERGEKMSKIKGNVLNPLDAIEQYGADALRLATTTGNSPGNDVRLSSHKLEAGRNFANKLWNAARFVIRSANDAEMQPFTTEAPRPTEDRWILSRLNRLTARANQLMEDYQFGEAERQIHDFVWGEFCDWYIEVAKIRLRDRTDPSPIPVLMRVLETSLLLLHPFMPFITEELWQSLPPVESRPESVMIARYPCADQDALDTQAEREMKSVIEIIRSVRNARAEQKIEAAKWIEAHVYAEDKVSTEQHAKTIEALSRARPLVLRSREEPKEGADKAIVTVLGDADVVLPMAGMVDTDAERQRLQKEIEQHQANISRLETRLGDSTFLSKAPPPVVEKEQARLTESRERMQKLEERLSQLA
jgi:valyl-tRNA synthetase